MSKVKCKTLLVDNSYQRTPEEHVLHKIEVNYDPRQVRKLYISQREDGSMYVIDGNHTRLAAMRVLGEDAMLEAEIYTGLTVEEEADMFVKLNSNSKKISFNDNLKARYKRNDKDVCDYIEALNSSLLDWSFARSGGKSDAPRALFVGHSMGMKAFKRSGKDCFVRACNIAALAEKQLAAQGKIIQALALLCSGCNKFDDYRMSSVLKSSTMADIEGVAKTYGRAIASSNSNVLPYTLALVDLYNKGLRKNRIKFRLEKEEEAD